MAHESIDLGDGRPALSITRPDSSEALIDERAFSDHEEYLPYWAELWPSAIVLARSVAREDLSGARVVELGCGLGLPALAAARAGARVLATDWAADAVAATRVNAVANDVPLRAVVADWRDGAAITARGPFDLVLAADVLYEARATEPLLELLRLLHAPRVLVADPSRTLAEPFLTQAARHWSLRTTTPEPGHPRVQLHDLRPPDRLTPKPDLTQTG